MFVSYVLPVYDEQDGIKRFHDELVAALAERPDITYELVYVNDGSADGSLSILRDLAKNDPQVQVVDFARNFGHQIAITAGLDQATGDAVIIMDTDLQDPPKVSLELIDAWREGAEIVHARRRRARTRLQAGHRARLLPDAAQRRRGRHPAGHRGLPAAGPQVADELRKSVSAGGFVRGIVASLGFRQTEVLFDRDERFAGETKYPLRKMARLAIDGVTGFSTMPLS